MESFESVSQCVRVLYVSTQSTSECVHKSGNVNKICKSVKESANICVPKTQCEWPFINEWKLSN